MIKINRFGPVTQFLLTKNTSTVACYYIDGYLIDSGQDHCKYELEKALIPYNLERIINTHSHEDHIGGNKLLQEKRGLPPSWAHPIAVKELETSSEWGNAMPEYRKRAWGVAESSSAQAIPDEINTGNYVLKPIYTPGHCKDHICLFEPDKGWLFSGDLFVSKNLNSVQYDETAPLIIESIEKIMRLPIKKMFCSYGKVYDNAYEQLNAKLENLKNWKSQIMDLHNSGFSEEEILHKVFEKESRAGIISAGCLSRAQFIHQIIYNEPLFIPTGTNG